MEWFDEVDDAIRRRDDLLRARVGDRPVEASKVRLTEIIPKYMAHLTANGATEKYKSHVLAILNRAIAANLDDVRSKGFPVAARNWLDGLKAKRNNQITETPASTRTRLQYQVTLKAALAYTVADLGWLNFNPMTTAAKPRTKWRRIQEDLAKHERSARKIITLPVLCGLVSDASRWTRNADRDATLAAIQAHGGDKHAAAAALQVDISTVYNRINAAEQWEDARWRLAVLMAYTGMRAGQAMALLWSDLDLRNRTIRLRAEVTGNRSGKEAVIRMEDELADLLGTLVPDAEEVIPAPRSSTGRVMARGWVTDSFHRWLADHGAGDHTAHDFRHSFVCILTAMGIPTADIKNRVNHSDVQMTARYADHLIERYRPLVAGWAGRLRLRGDPPAAGIVPMPIVTGIR